jgi:anti-sigma-K factor RskA
MQHEEIRDLLAAYALGSVPPDERREIALHILTCAGCRAEVADYEAVTGTLALATQPIEPPAGFTERVVAAAVGDRPSPATPAKTSRRWGRLGVLAGAMVLAAILAVGAQLLILEPRQESQRREDVLALLASSDGISLTGDGDVIGRVSGSEFAVAGIDSAPEGKTYQLWLMRGDGCPSDDPAECDLVSAGTFDTEEGVALVELEESAGSWEDAAVTIEDEDGARYPTTDAVLHSL